MKIQSIVDVVVRKTRNMVLEDVVVVFSYMFIRLVYTLYLKKILSEKDISYITMDE